MRLRDIKSIYHKELGDLYPKEEVDGIFNRVIDHYLNLQGFIVTLQPEFTLTKEEEQPLFEALSQLRQEMPVQYVLGQTYFMDMPLMVDPAVLIPRPETEELVAWIMADIRKYDGPVSILDIGTGSGNIAIAIKKNAPEMQVFALDKSEEALEVARQNGAMNKVEITWLHQDIEEEAPLAQVFDIVVANPPYVLESEKERMRNNVKTYEPAEALFVKDDDALRFYRAILERCREILCPGGCIYFEINEAKARDMEDLLRLYGYSEIQLKKDIFGKDRMIRAKSPQLSAWISKDK